jgi:hypothetical protein
MEVTKATYSEDGKELWLTVRASDGEFMNIHVNASVMLNFLKFNSMGEAKLHPMKLMWEKSGVVLNLKEK